MMYSKVRARATLYLHLQYRMCNFFVRTRISIFLSICDDMEFDESDFRAKLLTFFFFVPIFGKIEVKDLLNE